MPTGITLLHGLELSPRAARVHAMKNSVSVLLALCHLAERGGCGGDQERWRMVRSAAGRLRGLLAEELAAGSVEAEPESRFEAERCNVGGLVRSAAERLEARADEAEVHLEIDCGGGTIHADRASLGEALFNLMANAIEATPPGGTVHLETRHAPNGDQQWILKDTGHGIPADQLASLGRACRTGKQGGSGLGVALARATIARHGGLLRIESEGGSGTTVTILLERDGLIDSARRALHGTSHLFTESSQPGAR
jgi:two-component system, NtrC family, sensor histidine kinase HydH